MSSAVLVVEDYADLRSAIAEALTRGHYTCEAAATARDAIGRLQEHQFGAILLSPSLPLNLDPVMSFLIQYQPDELHKVILMMDDSEDASYPTLLKPFGQKQLLAKLPPA